MGLLNLLRKKPSDEALRDSLFDAVASANAEAVREMTARHAERIGQLFPTWTTLPASVRADPARTRWWAEGMIGIASAAAELGDASLMARLQGPPETNEIVLWQRALFEAESAAARGDHASGIRLVEQALETAKGLTGAGVDDLAPKSYGLLGTLHYRAGNLDAARKFTLEAKAYCERTGDSDGAQIYASNINVIDAVERANPAGSSGD
jgi:hypothetical protein